MGCGKKAGSAKSARGKVKETGIFPIIAKNTYFFPVVIGTYGFMGKDFRPFTKMRNLLSIAIVEKRNLPLSKLFSI
jgi:hypothetical protein